VRNNLSFVELLVYLAFALFAIFAVILLKNRSRRLDSEKSAARSGHLFLLYVGIVLLFTFISTFYFLQGPISLLWFALYSAVLFPSLYFASSSRSNQKTGSLLIVLLMVALQVAAPIIQNRGYIYGSDEWRDFRVTTFIVQTGGTANAPFFRGDFYSAIPLFDIENGILSELSGSSGMWVISSLAVASALFSALAVYAIMMRLTRSSVLSLLTIVLSVGAPRGSSGQYLPQTLGSMLGTILVFLIVFSFDKGRKSLLIAGLVMVFSASFVHPSGLVSFFLLSLGILILWKLLYNQQLSRQASRIAGFFTLSLVVSLACWSSQPVLFNGVIGPVVTFLKTLVSVRQFGSSYQFQYNAPSLQVYALPWALPVAAGAAFLSYSLFRIWKQRNARNASGLEKEVFTGLFFVSAALMGLIFLFGGFFSIVTNPGAGIERYVTGSAYGLLSLSAAFLLFSILRFGKAYAFVVLAIVIVSFSIGIASPDNAPFENPSFGAVRTTWPSTIEAYDWARFLSPTATVYGDHDTPVASLVNWPALQTEEYVGFEPIRQILQTLKTNSFDPSNKSYGNAIFVIKSDEIADAGLRSNFVDTIYDSSRHLAIIMPLAADS
jgi:hypothetical protein